jgi:hypothetical protein
MFGLGHKKEEVPRPSVESKDSSGMVKMKALKSMMNMDTFKTLVLEIKAYKVQKDRVIFEPKFKAILKSDLNLTGKPKYDEAQSLLYSLFKW